MAWVLPTNAPHRAGRVANPMQASHHGFPTMLPLGEGAGSLAHGRCTLVRAVGFLVYWLGSAALPQHPARQATQDDRIDAARVLPQGQAEGRTLMWWMQPWQQPHRPRSRIWGRIGRQCGQVSSRPSTCSLFKLKLGLQGDAS